MQKIIYPGHNHQPCEAEYGISVDRHAADHPRADIVVVDSRESTLRHTSLVHHQPSRDALLNKILRTDLVGVRIDRVRFFVIPDLDAFAGLRGWEFPITVDLEDYKRAGNPVRVEKLCPRPLLGRVLFCFGFHIKRETVLYQDVVGGCPLCQCDLRQTETSN